MAEKMITAIDARTEKVRYVSVLIDPGEKPVLTMDGKPLTEDETAALGEWDRRLAAILKEDFLAHPLFDGERIYDSRSHFTLSQSAGEAGGGETQ